MLCLLRPCHLTLFIVLAALSPACSPLLDAYFVSPVCIERCVLVFPYCLSLLNLIGNFLFLFLPSPTPPFSCRPFLVCSSCVCPCTRACEFFRKQRRKWEEGLCETSEFLWLQPSFLFLPSSVSHTLFLPPDSSGSDTWINMKVPYFFFVSPLLLSVWGFTHSPREPQQRGGFLSSVSFSAAHHSLRRQDKVPLSHSSCLISGTLKDGRSNMYFCCCNESDDETIHLNWLCSETTGINMRSAVDFKPTPWTLSWWSGRDQMCVTKSCIH